MNRPVRSIGLWLFALLGAAAPVFSAPSDYIWQKEAVSGIGSGADAIKADLEAHINEMINTGIMQPALYRIGMIGNFILYGQPAETVYILSDAYPLVSAATQSRIKTYLQNYMQTYPPLSRSYVHGNSDWGNVTLANFSPRREYYQMPPTLDVNIWPPPPMPLETIYMMWRYADATGDWTYLQNNMSALQNLYNGYAAPATRYGQIAGLIGMARIADHFGNTTLRDEAVNKATAAMAASNYSTWLQIAQSSNTYAAHDYSYPIFHSRRLVTVMAMFAPEEGRFIRDNQLTDAMQTLSLLIGTNASGHAQGSEPGWFIHHADHDYSEYIYKNVPWFTPGNNGNQMQGGENGYNPPDFAWTFYMIRAYVLQDSAVELQQMLDMPTCIGDLYYIQRLATAIRAFGTRSWVDVRAAANSTPPAAPKNLRLR